MLCVLLLLMLLLAPAIAVLLLLSDAGAVDCGLEYLPWWCLFFGITWYDTLLGPVPGKWSNGQMVGQR
jgi:hypothetical protein